MKVYVVIGGYTYEDTYILGVAKTQKVADEIVKRQKDDLDWVSIDEWDVKE